MNLKIFIISSLYKGYIINCYKKNSFLKNSSFDDHLNFIKKDSSEMVPTYTKTLASLGVNTFCIFDNDIILLKKWCNENKVAFTNTKEAISKQIQWQNPDVLWIDDVNYLDKDWIDNIRSKVPSIKVVFANHCAPYTDRIVEGLKGLDFVITCTPGLKLDFENRGIKTYLVYHAFDALILNQLSTAISSPRIRFVFLGSLFTGSGYHKQRIELIEDILMRDINLTIYGNVESTCKIRSKQVFYYTYKLFNTFGLGNILSKLSIFRKYENYGKSPIKKYSKQLKKSLLKPVFGIEMYNILKGSDIVLNTHGEVAGNYAGNVRLFETTGVGSCLLTDEKANMKDLFVPNKEVVTYTSIEDCINKAKWLLENESERKRIAEAGQNRTLTTHNVESRCMQIIEIITTELALKD